MTRATCLAALTSGCLGSPPSADSTPDAGAEADAQPCVPREQYAYFDDRFDDDSLIWADSVNREPVDSPMTTSIDANRLAVDLVDMNAHMLWIKTLEFDVRGLRVTLEVVELPNPQVDGARAWFSILPRNMPESSIDLMYLEDRLETPNEVVSYSATADHWWQMRVTDAELIIETSADGMSWTAVDAVPIPEGLEAAVFEIGAKTDTNGAGAGRLLVDNLNLPPERCP